MIHRSLAAKCLVSSLVATVLLTTGCKEEDTTVPTLFDEDGVWALTRYDIEGEGTANDLLAHRDASFLLNFNKADKVVQTASCVFPGTDDDEEKLSPGDTPCGFIDDGTEWQCQCFGYAFEHDEMRWVEFNAGDLPPVVELEAAATGGGAGGSGGESGSGGDTAPADTGEGTLMTVSEVPDVNFTFNFRPLPDGVFDSNGTNSRFVMQARGASTFATVLDDPMRPSCAPCVAPEAE